MRYNIKTDVDFDKGFKKLAKKYPSLKNDLQELIKNIENELKLADDLGNGFKKIRINIKSKGKGSSGGGRIISYDILLTTTQTEIIFALIYDKGEYSTADLKILKKNLGI